VPKGIAVQVQAAELAEGDDDLRETAEVAMRPVVARLPAVRRGQDDLV
jgi:hypothetical protein